MRVAEAALRAVVAVLRAAGLRVVERVDVLLRAVEAALRTGFFAVVVVDLVADVEVVVPFVVVAM